MLRARARPRPDPAFAPVPLADADVERDRKRVGGELGVALGRLEASLPTLPPAVREEARLLLAARAGIERRIGELSVRPRGARRIRIHGDYHLGQVLLTKNDFFFIDFEGEPGRIFDERREKQSALRDIAGMLRSFAYARESALRGAAITAEEAERFRPTLREWEAQARAAFLRGYADATRDAGLYDELDAERGLLGLLVLEKALYELRYELANRPDWAAIPLRGLLDIAAPGARAAPGVLAGER
jgi:maltose alpha-D-glucosyltransferase/alpha-amylase